MTRLPPLDYDAMSPAQRAVHDAIVSGPRGSVRGPFQTWMRNPEMADAAQKLGEYFRFNTHLPRDQAEIAILVTGQHYRSEFEFWAHSALAREAGVPDDVIEAIRSGDTPEFATAAERVVYQTARALNARHRLTDAEYETALETLGEQGLVDVIGLCGYYAMVSLTLNVAEVPTPDGRRIFPDP
ncbi:MAG: carboxymuconolactone decarboxylase family protein [Pseudomonadota bacterium]